MTVKLKSDFFLREDVVQISKDLLGKVLCTAIDGRITSGIITETEAYAGITDKASHAYRGRRTPRTETMFGQGGQAYVYLCYGIHRLFNIVTNTEGIPHAVLVRSIKPVEGIETILERRNKPALTNTITTGPGTVAQALGIRIAHTGENMYGKKIWVEDRNIRVHSGEITASPRVGIDYAGDHALLPWRFRIS